MSMAIAVPPRCELVDWPVDWSFPDGEVWITGWLETRADEGMADVRAWIDDEIFLGFFDLPFAAGQAAFPGSRRFVFKVQAWRDSRRLRLEVWSARRGWTEYFQTPVTGTAIRPGGECKTRPWLGQLARFAGVLVRNVTGSFPAMADEVVRSAVATPLNLLPVPPFIGTLETPSDDGYVRRGQLLVSGWLVHRMHPIRKMTARVGGAPEVRLHYGLQRRDVGEQYPELPSASHSHFVGLVDLPGGVIGLAPLFVFAETDDGAVSLVFARRFLPCELPITDGVLPGWRQFRPARALMMAVHRHGVSWWEVKNMITAVRAPGAVEQAAGIAAQGAFAESTPLSLFLSSFEDHELRPAGQGSPRSQQICRVNVLFVLHCDFSCASALHVLALARELTQSGYACIVAVPERLDTLADHEDPGCSGILHADAMDGVVFPDGRGPDLLHAWTTRECVRVVTERLQQIHGDAKLLVHLEDNEEQILATALRRSASELLLLSEGELDRLVSPDMSHPRRGPRFLGKADGVTLVIDTLAAFVPAGIPVQVITPAADRRYFYPRPDLRDFRRLLDPAGDATILFYPGNVHPANAAEMGELYAAILELNRTGSPTRLIRTGCNQVDFLGPLADEVAPFVTEMGRVRRHRHVAPLMALADMFVQPGVDNAFNACRLPSKLPEFFALGRPVILPRTNLGRVARHGLDAFVLAQADSTSIAGAVKKLRADHALSAALAHGAAAFAEKHFNWERSAGLLAEFYASILAVGVKTE